mmetsp:Transcript_95234/g.149947  ORF Transcript_95234/g.149947 Transcript_95234/m.149947 type:complete len:249 (+) Transcript_95234:1103-1849(+)
MVFAPMASPILMASPVQCSPFVVGRCNKSGRYLANNESEPKSAPNPPEQKITGPNSLKTLPPLRYSHPTTAFPLRIRLKTSALVIMRPRSVFSQTFSSIWMSAYVMVMPGKRSFPRWVRGCECPPRRASKDKSRSNLSISQSTSAALFWQSTLASSGLFAPPFKVSATKISELSGMPLAFWVLVPAPLIPLVAFELLPPQNEDLSSKSVLPPHSTTVFPADTPANPPPTTMTWLAGKTAAIALCDSLR